MYNAIATQGDNLFVHNVKFQNTYEQMLKGTSAGDGADNGIVQCSLFEYPAGIGPQFYIGGLDIHKGDNWIVRDNIFKNIASPSGSLAEHAVHFWNSSSNNTVERNWIINCDRGIGFGLGNSPNQGGLIRNNMIYNDGTHPFHDGGIGLESSPDTRVFNNTVYIEYPNAIEYRFAATTNVVITNNLTNKLIKSRNDGQASLTTNYTTAEAAWFEEISNGNLRLNGEIPQVFDTGTDLSNEVEVDFDQNPRPQSDAFDIGAHEFMTPVGTQDEIIADENIELFPNPAANAFIIRSDSEKDYKIHIYNLLNQQMAFFEGISLRDGLIINTKEWNNGWYICQVENDNQITQTIQIIVMK